MPQAPTLSQFASTLRLRNVAKPTHYYVEIVPPPAFQRDPAMLRGADPKLVSLWCSQAMTPQVTINTKDEYLENGTRRKFAFDQDYQNLTLHFYLDQLFDIQRFFDQWKYCVVPQRRLFGYPDDYTAESLNLFIINEAGEATYKYEYSRVFPKSVNSVELSYATGGAVATFSVDFVFEEVYFTSFKDGYTSKPEIQAEPALRIKPNNMEVRQSISSINYDQLGNVINSDYL